MQISYVLSVLHTLGCGPHRISEQQFLVSFDFSSLIYPYKFEKNQTCEKFTYRRTNNEWSEKLNLTFGVDELKHFNPHCTRYKGHKRVMDIQKRAGSPENRVVSCMKRTILYKKYALNKRCTMSYKPRRTVWKAIKNRVKKYFPICYGQHIYVSLKKEWFRSTITLNFFNYKS